MNEELLNTKLKDLILPRMGYLFVFIDDYLACWKKYEEDIFKAGYQVVPVTDVYQRIEEHIFEYVGHLTVRNVHDLHIPDYKYKKIFGVNGVEKEYLFNFFITWDDECQQIEIEYDSYVSN